MSGTPPPILAIIVPVRDEEVFLHSCLDSILRDSPPEGIEVIVVDGMSEDRTAQIALEFTARDRRVRLLRNPSRFVPQAMNSGIAASTAPYVGRIDGHCLVVPGYFAGCLARLQTGGYDCVGGVLINEGATPAGRAIAAATSSPVGVGSARFRTGRGHESFVDTLAFGVYRREVFERVGLFDEAFVRNQDDELNLRLTRAGGKILLAPALRIRYFVRESIRSLGRQYFQYGYWKWKVFRKHGRFASLRHLAPPIFISLLALALLTSPFIPVGRATLAILLLSYLVTVLGEALRLSLTRSAPWGRTALALMALHFSYGAGMLKAIIDEALPVSGRRSATGPTSPSR